MKARNGVEEGGRFQSGYIGIYITLLASRYLRACRSGGYNRTQLYFIIDGPEDACEFRARVKWLTVRTLTDTAMLQSVDATPVAYSCTYSSLLVSVPLTCLCLSCAKVILQIPHVNPNATRLSSYVEFMSIIPQCFLI